MARIRNLKPEFWTDGNIVQLSFAARLFYQGTWNFALCDRGHLPDDPMELKLKILPADDVDPAALVEELVTFGRLVRGTAPDGRRYLRIARLADHNKVDPRWSPRCPYCAAESGSSSESRPASPKLPDTPASHTEPPRNSPQEGKGREGKVGEGKKDISPELAPRDPDLSQSDRPEIDRICRHLADRMVENGCKRPTITQKWRDAARLMLDRDKRTEEQIHAAIDWCQSDSFWRGNILSLPKLRDKYDQLSMAARRPSNGGPRPSTTDQRVAQAQAGRADGQVASIAEIFERSRRNKTIPGEIA
jgi:hypothetical protein